MWLSLLACVDGNQPRNTWWMVTGNGVIDSLSRSSKEVMLRFGKALMFYSRGKSPRSSHRLLDTISCCDIASKGVVVVVGHHYLLPKWNRGFLLHCCLSLAIGMWDISLVYSWWILSHLAPRRCVSVVLTMTNSRWYCLFNVHCHCIDMVMCSTFCLRWPFPSFLFYNCQARLSVFRLHLTFLCWSA
jgi:hypothetical protein